jgi:hypothetical protein
VGIDAPTVPNVAHLPGVPAGPRDSQRVAAHQLRAAQGAKAQNELLLSGLRTEAGGTGMEAAGDGVTVLVWVGLMGWLEGALMVSPFTLTAKFGPQESGQKAGAPGAVRRASLAPCRDMAVRTLACEVSGGSGGVTAAACSAMLGPAGSYQSCTRQLVRIPAGVGVVRRVPRVRHTTSRDESGPPSPLPRSAVTRVDWLAREASEGAEEALSHDARASSTQVPWGVAALRVAPICR